MAAEARVDRWTAAVEERLAFLRATGQSFVDRAAELERRAQDLDAEIEACDDPEAATMLHLERIDVGIEIGRLDTSLRQAEAILDFARQRWSEEPDPVADVVEFPDREAA